MNGSLAKVKMVCLVVLFWEVNHSRIELALGEMHGSCPLSSPPFQKRNAGLDWSVRNPDLDCTLLGGSIT